MDTGTFGIHQHDGRPSAGNHTLNHSHRLARPRGSSKPETGHVPGNTAKTTVRTQENLQANNDHNLDDVGVGMQREKMTMSGHTMHMPGVLESESNRPENQSMSMGTFGAVIIVFDQKSIMQGLNAILWRLAPTSLVGITMTLLLCYLLLHHQVLKPIGSIRTAMMRQQTGERDARSITEAVIGIGRNLGLTVIAEGVETQAQLALLKKLGCDLAQGYGICKPMDADDLGIWLGEQGPELCVAIG